MIGKMIRELSSYLFCLLVIIFSFFITMRLLERFLKVETGNMFEILLDVINGINS